MGQDVCLLRKKSPDHSTEFLQAVFQSPVIANQLSNLMVGSTFKRANVQQIRNFSVPMPPPPEQRAIAGVLSDVDALTGALDQLIAKKRDLKQAAMQQLLTGQTRLPGFHGEWVVKRLGELAEIISGGTPKTADPSYWNGSIKWCTPTDITGCSGKYLLETERAISTGGLASCSAQLLPVGSLLLCSRATIGEVRIAGCEICTNQGFKSLVRKPGVSNEFLYYKVLTMKSQMVERAIGSTFLEISKKDTAALQLPVPEHDEQTAIAGVLSDLDAELAALEQRRDKTRALKQGMMQELLTGRTRLV
jgi:type I restriction enzyme S subunit